MANLPELNEFTPGVYQIETADPVLGGVDGTTNVPLKALANRTQWLKQQVDSLNTAIASAIGAAYVQGELDKRAFKEPVRVASTSNITLTGLQTVDGVSVTAGTRVLVKNQTTAAQNGIYLAQTTAWTRAADMNENAELMPGLAVLVTGGTAQADTLWVLSTDGTLTVGTSALAFKDLTGAFAPLVSPALTGNPTAPTPAQFDNDTSLATTAFVRSELLGLGNTAYDAIFGKSLSASGWQRLPSGLIIQWGAGTSNASGDISVAFPIAFPTAVARAVVCEGAGSSWASNTAIVYGISTITNTTLNAKVRTIVGTGGPTASSGLVGNWFAIGY